MIYKKAVVLNALDNSLKKAVVNLDCKSGMVSGDVKLYNFVEEPMGVLTLGLMVEGKVQKAGLTRTGYMQYSFGSILSKIPANCTCAIVSSVGGSSEPLLLGSIQKNDSALENALLENLSLLREKNVEKIQSTLDESIGEYEDKDEIEEKIDECLKDNCTNCAHCHYKNAFYEQTFDNQEEPENDLKKDFFSSKGKLRVPDKENFNFFDEIGGQIQGLFDNYPHETVLEDIIPNSKWAKIDFNKDGKYYVVGLIYENEDIKFVCYGVPAKWSEHPPADFNENARWLAIDLAEPQGDGYWITYQDAVNGDLVAVNII